MNVTIVTDAVRPMPPTLIDGYGSPFSSLVGGTSLKTYSKAEMPPTLVGGWSRGVTLP